MRRFSASLARLAFVGIALCACGPTSSGDDATSGDGAATSDTPATNDGGNSDTSSTRDPTGLYGGCTLASGCTPAGQTCLEMSGPMRTAGACTFLCGHDAECPNGVCVRSMSSSDPRYRCVQTCAMDADCATGFACLGVFLMTIDGAMTRRLCFPN